MLRNLDCTCLCPVQHTPEVLYLCTMCDGALRPGTDGRWMRRKRPSSAPAIGKRRLEHSDEAESSNIGDKEDQWRHRRMVCMNINREEAAAKLTFALCARRIQQVYQDYRHRQYLKGWALSLVRRYCHQGPNFFSYIDSNHAYWVQGSTSSVIFSLRSICIPDHWW